MATVTRPVLSVKNEYHISKHRYYELKHFCLQYEEWKKEYRELEPAVTAVWKEKVDEKGTSDSTGNIATQRAQLSKKMNTLEEAARKTDSVMALYILEAATEGYSYETMQARRNVPCCKEVWYKLYRKFFWILNTLRG